MKYHNCKSQTHPVHVDIQPIVSAFKHGRKRIGHARFQKICIKRNLMRWESLVVGSLVREACAKQQVTI
jgi:hypothetical protein